MKINIGDNNRINNSIIGENNYIENIIKNEKNDDVKEKNKFNKYIIELLIAVIAGLIVGYFIYRFGWNK